MERGEEMENKATPMGTHLKRAGVLTGLVLSFSLVFVGDSAPLTITGNSSFYIGRSVVSETPFSHGVLLTSPDSLLPWIPSQASPNPNFFSKEPFVRNLRGSPNIFVNPSLRSPTFPRGCLTWRHSTTIMEGKGMWDIITRGLMLVAGDGYWLST